MRKYRIKGAHPESEIELFLSLVHAVHGHGVEADEGVQLGSPTMHESRIGVTDPAGESNTLHSLGVFAHHQSTHNCVLEETELKYSEQRIGVKVGEVVNSSEGLLRRLLGPLQRSRLHILHHCDQVDEDDYIFAGHPLKTIHLLYGLHIH